MGQTYYYIMFALLAASQCLNIFYLADRRAGQLLLSAERMSNGTLPLNRRAVLEDFVTRKAPIKMHPTTNHAKQEIIEAFSSSRNSASGTRTLRGVVNYASPQQARQQAGQTATAKPVELLIAKTLSPFDVDETIQDILAMHNKPPTTIHGRLFCWSKTTYKKLQDKLGERLIELNVELVLKEKVLKTYFWYNHLTKDNIPATTDYIWLLDGDIVIRHMAWDCYWNIIHRYQPAINQPALIDEPGREQHNFWTAVSHPSACFDNKEFSQLVGIETSFVEQQAPMFRRDAWMAVRTVLDDGMGPWYHSKSSWGIDNVWCGIVQTDLMGVTYQTFRDQEPAIPFQLRDTCQVERVERNQERPIGCMIVHATPVVHMDTNAYDDKSRERQNEGLARQRAYKEAFPKYFRYPCGDVVNNRKCQASRFGFHRSLWMNEPCQTCRHWNCTSYHAPVSES